MTLLCAARPVGLLLLGTAVFALAYCQAPLYYSNQNQYFLHPLAEAGVGQLDADWLANTRDPTPAFSALARVTAENLPAWTFYLEYALLQGVYAVALFGLFVLLVGPEAARRRWPLFVALFVAAHSGLARWCSARLCGADYPWFLQAGVAGQYVLGAALQPSVFGVFLVLAVVLFLADRPFAAAVSVAVAATFHPSLLLAGALLTAGFLTALVAEGRRRESLRVGGLALLLVLPVTAHVLLVFRPTSAADFAAAQRLLVKVRIPHHCQPRLWFDAVAALQLLWIAAGLALARRTRLVLALAVPFALAALLTVVVALLQLRPDEGRGDTLALLFPWRVSSVLVPLATAVVLARLAALPLPALDAVGPRALAGVVLALLAAGGVWIMADRQGFRGSDEERGVLEYVRGQVYRARGAEEVYFLPVSIPDLEAKTHGSLSSDFKPPDEKRRDPRVIPPDLQRFRLATGAPIYVDFKSIPYKDTEVLEWKRRLDRAAAVQERLRKAGLYQPDVVAELREMGVTYVVIPASWGLADDRALRVYPQGQEDDAYRIYRLPGMTYNGGFARLP